MHIYKFVFNQTQSMFMVKFTFSGDTVNWEKLFFLQFPKLYIQSFYQRAIITSPPGT